MKTVVKICFLLLSVYASSLYAAELVGKIVGVHDGDTVTFLTSDNKQIKVRLAEIDAPELAQPYGNKSKQHLSGLIFGKSVTLDVVEKDRYGRSVGKIYSGAEYVNAEMVKSGHAWAYKQYLKDKSFLEFESSAKSQKIGLWSLPDAEIVPPWEWRKSEGKSNKKQDQDEDKKITSNKSGGGFSCDGKSKCGDMSSCAEAKFYLNSCGVRRLDRDNDGIPCESICK
jgi:endonuclease YncB( thermonuclease family)